MRHIRVEQIRIDLFEVFIKPVLLYNTLTQELYTNGEYHYILEY